MLSVPLWFVDFCVEAEAELPLRLESELPGGPVGLLRASPEIDAGLSVRASEEACIFLKHPLFEAERWGMLPEVLTSSFAGRSDGRWNDANTDAGVVWAWVERTLEEDAKTRG